MTAAPTAITTMLSGGAPFGGAWCWWLGSAVTVFAGTPVTDSAALTGANASSATGTVTYSVFGAYESGGSWHYGQVASGGTVSVSSGVVPASNPVTLPPGTYTWQASYSR